MVTSYRPRGDGPFPWIVFNHGAAVSVQANREIGRNRNLPLMREWVQRGYAVLVPVRRGYGASGGAAFGDARGSCNRPGYRASGEGASLDVLATVNWARTQRDLDSRRWMLVGQSAGAFASIYAASKRPAGLTAVLAFAPGRGGDPDLRPGEPCAPEQMAALFKSVAPLIEVPVLWFYAANDEFFNVRVQKLWFDSFREGGGRGDLVVAPPFPERRGHGVFTSARGAPLWKPAVTAFFASQRVDLPFPP